MEKNKHKSPDSQVSSRIMRLYSLSECMFCNEQTVTFLKIIWFAFLSILMLNYSHKSAFMSILYLLKYGT